MIKQLSTIAALGLAAFGTAQAGFLEKPTNVAFRLGFVYPVDSTMRNVSNSFLGLGVDIYAPSFHLLENGETFLSFDLFTKSVRFDRGTAVPIMINQKFYTGTDLKERSYWFAGVGVAFIDFTSSDTALAARIGMGKEFGPNTFGEVSFTYTGEANGARATSAGAYIGYRF